MDSAAEASDAMFGSSVVVRSFRRRHPDEPILYSAAAILVPGWSPQDSRRARVMLGARRGTLIVTPARLFFTTGGIQPLALVWLFALGAIGLGLVLTREWLLLVLAAAPVQLLVQRLPSTRDIPLETVEAIEVRPLEGRIAPAWSVALRLPGDAFRFNTNKLVEREALTVLTSHGQVSD